MASFRFSSPPNATKTRIKADAIFIFLWEDQPHFDERGRPYATVLKEEFPPLRKANFVQPPPLVNGVLERRQLNAFVDQVVGEIMTGVVNRLGAAGDTLIPSWVIALACLLGFLFLAVAAALARKR
jgi:hypothetical protein